MNYNDIKMILFARLEKSVVNNKYYFDIYDIQRNFYNLYESTVSILLLKPDPIFIEISILFEFLLKNYFKFCEILDKNNDNNLVEKSESLDVLCFLNVNIFIVENLNNLFKELNLTDDDIQNCLDSCKFNFMEVSDINYKNYRNKIAGFFNKIIEVYSSKVCE
jgi:hypothetical protein